MHICFAVHNTLRFTPD